MKTRVLFSKRLVDYLFLLGFDYKQVVDKTKKQDFVWLMEDSEALRESIRFFKEIRRINFNK